MIGIHIYPSSISYTSNHSDITRELGDSKITLSYHNQYDKQVFFESDKYLIFLDGWIFNSPSYTNQAEFILEKYVKDSVNFIYELNGQFNLVICNKVELKYNYYNDIFSIRKHFFSFENSILFLSSDLTFITNHLNKKNLNVDHIKKNINLPRFIDIKETFINEIKQGFPCMKITENTISSYSFEKVKHNFSYEEKNPIFFLDKIKNTISRTYKNEDLLLLLTGGLDSRFLLEIFKELNLNFQTATYGNKISDEVQIASKVAEVNDIKHFICHLDAEDFLVDAKNYIKNFSGLDIFVQSTIYKFLSSLKLKVNKNTIIDTGFALDMFLGGSQLNKEINHDLAIENRVFSALSIRQSAIREFYEDRYSMYNYDIYFMMRNLPKDLIKDNKFYYKLCKLQIKKSFHIPLQSTMFGLSLEPKFWKSSESIQFEKEKFVLEYFQKNNKALYHNRYYSDFGMWIRDETAWKNFILDMFVKNKSNLSKMFLDQKLIENTINQHMSGEENHIRKIIKWVSLELFFQVN
jgi:hypothetical protein